MKLLENKKLFGKINIIDVIIILILLAGVIYIKVESGKTSAATTREIQFQVELQKMPEVVPELIKAGDKIFDNETNVYIGEVVSVETIPYTRVEQNNITNEFVSVDEPNCVTARVTLKNNFVESASDIITVDGYNVKVGKEVYSRGPNYAGRGYVVYIERVDIDENN